MLKDLKIIWSQTVRYNIRKTLISFVYQMMFTRNSLLLLLYSYLSCSQNIKWLKKSFKQLAWLRRIASSNKFAQQSLERESLLRRWTTKRLSSWSTHWCLYGFGLVCACIPVRVWFRQVNQTALESCHQVLCGLLLALLVHLKSKKSALDFHTKSKKIKQIYREFHLERQRFPLWTSPLLVWLWTSDCWSNTCRFPFHRQQKYIFRLSRDLP